MDKRTNVCRPDASRRVLSQGPGEEPGAKTRGDAPATNIIRSMTKVIFKHNPKSLKLATKKGESVQFVFVMDKGEPATLKGVKETLADIKPLNFDFILAKGSRLEVLGLILGKKDDLFKVNFNFNHLQPETIGHAWFKSILRDESQQEIKGIVKIKKGAQKTDSYLSHRTLLLSSQARSKNTPLLEIDEEDVKAGHASTTSRIDRDQLFYLRSRGLSQEKAEKVIVDGFIQELIEKVKDKKIKTKLTLLINKKA